MKQSQYHTIVSWSFLALQLCKFLAIFYCWFLHNAWTFSLLSLEFYLYQMYLGVIFFLMFCNIIEWFYRLSLALSMPVAAASLTETVKVNILSHPFFFFWSFMSLEVLLAQFFHVNVSLKNLSLLFTSISDIEQKNCWHLQQILW